MNTDVTCMLGNDVVISLFWCLIWFSAIRPHIFCHKATFDCVVFCPIASTTANNICDCTLCLDRLRATLTSMMQYVICGLLFYLSQRAYNLFSPSGNSFPAHIDTSSFYSWLKTARKSQCVDFRAAWYRKHFMSWNNNVCSISITKDCLECKSYYICQTLRTYNIWQSYLAKILGQSNRCLLLLIPTPGLCKDSSIFCVHTTFL